MRPRGGPDMAAMMRKVTGMFQRIVGRDGGELARRLEGDGLLLLPCPDSLRAAIEGLWRAADRFFALPLPRKRANSLPEHDGYHGIGEEYSDRPDRPDLAESFWARLLHASATGRFPDPEGRSMHRAALTVSAGIESLLTPLTEALARHYAERWSPDLAFGCDRASHLQFNHYQPKRHGREILADAHEDGLYLTLLFADAPGLEVRTPAGVWVPVQPRPGELIAMPGEIFTLLCGGRVQPLWHRVRNHPEVARRYAMMYFANPNPVVGFRPWIADPGNAGVDIIERAITNPIRYGLPPLPRVPPVAVEATA
jgi:isopenicillin N synthase-like dioxygenase